MTAVTPSFELADGGIVLAALRAITVAALLSSFGAGIFRLFCVGRAFAAMSGAEIAGFERALRRVLLASLAVAALAGAGWFLTEANAMADGAGLAQTVAALFGTRFGHVMILQFIAVCAAALSLYWRLWRLATLASAVGTALEAGHGHLLAMGGWWSAGWLVEIVHLAGAGVWLGGLVPLLVLVRMAPPRAGAGAARDFSPIGKAAVIAVSLSACIQGWLLVGSFPRLIGTAYGWIALAKSLVLLILVGLACLHRYRLAPRLLGPQAERTKLVLVRSLAVQVLSGLLVVGAAALLGSLPPSIHVQPVWPFGEQPSLVTVQEDPDFLHEVVEAMSAIAGAILLAAASVAWRRVRWPAIAIAAITVWLAVPHLDLLLIEAHPTSFFESPTGFASPSIVSGAALFAQNCTSCHGVDGRGDGALATRLAVPPADLTATHLWAHSDGELFWWLTTGMTAPDGSAVMPGFAGSLSDDQRWALIDYIRAHNAGLVFNGTASWSPPLKAPDFTARCSGASRTLESFRGKVVRLVFAASGSAPPAPVPAGTRAEVATIVANLDPAAARPPVPTCTADDPAVAKAYAIVSGQRESAMAGRQFLIDPDGWLRASAGDEPAESLLASIEEICTHPISGGGEGHAHHHHQP